MAALEGYTNCSTFYDFHLSDTHTYICVSYVFLTMTKGFNCSTFYDLHLSDTHTYICVSCVLLTMTKGFILSRSSITLNAHKNLWILSSLL